MQNTVRNLAILSLAALFATMFVVPFAPARAVTNTFRQCDVVAGIGSGQFNWLRPDVCPGVPSSLTLQATLTSGSFSTFTTGASFDVASCDSAGVVAGIPLPNPGVPCLYATEFSTASVAVYDNTGAFLWFCGGAGNFGSGTESVNVIPGTKLVVGQANTNSIATTPLPCLAGSAITQHGPTTVHRGTDWVDTQSDKCTVNYTSESSTIYTFDVCANTQGANVASGTLTGANAYANRFIAGTGDLVADTSHVAVVNAGVESSTCDSTSTGAGGLFSMDVNPGGKEFAVGSFTNNKIDYITTAHCVAGQTAPDATFDAIQGATTTGLFGVAIYGEVTAVTPPTNGVPEFNASAMLVAAIGLAAIVLFRKTSLIKVR